MVIAAGSRPVIPPVIAASGVPYHTNDDIMRLPELPGRVLIVGSGFIAAEFAHVFSGLGSKVTVIARDRACCALRTRPFRGVSPRSSGSGGTCG